MDRQTFVKRLITILHADCAGQRKTHAAASQPVHWNSFFWCALVARVNSVLVSVSRLFVDGDGRLARKNTPLAG